MIKQRCPEYIYEESEVLEALLGAAQQQIDNFPSAIESATVNWFINTATGNYLDKIGTLASLQREGRTDEDYRTAILSKIRGVAGVMPVLLSIAQEVTNDEAYITEPAAGQIKVYTKASATTGKADILKARIRMAKVAGVEDLYEQLTGLIDTYSMAESLSSAELVPPYLWDSAFWDFAEWS